MLEISDLESREIVLLCSKNKGADQLRGHRAADLRLCFSSMQKSDVNAFSVFINRFCIEFVWDIFTFHGV